MRKAPSREFFNDIEELTAPSGVSGLDNQDILDATFAYDSQTMWDQLMEEGGEILDFLVGFAHRLENS